jgi:hypothetical protein
MMRHAQAEAEALLRRASAAAAAAVAASASADTQRGASRSAAAKPGKQFGWRRFRDDMPRDNAFEKRRWQRRRSILEMINDVRKPHADPSAEADGAAEAEGPRRFVWGSTHCGAAVRCVAHGTQRYAKGSEQRQLSLVRLVDCLFVVLLSASDASPQSVRTAGEAPPVGPMQSLLQTKLMQQLLGRRQRRVAPEPAAATPADDVVSSKRAAEIERVGGARRRKVAFGRRDLGGQRKNKFGFGWRLLSLLEGRIDVLMDKEDLDALQEEVFAPKVFYTAMFGAPTVYTHTPHKLTSKLSRPTSDTSLHYVAGLGT